MPNFGGILSLGTLPLVSSLGAFWPWIYILSLVISSWIFWPWIYISSLVISSWMFYSWIIYPNPELRMLRMSYEVRYQSLHSWWLCNENDNDDDDGDYNEDVRMIVTHTQMYGPVI